MERHRCSTCSAGAHLGERQEHESIKSSWALPGVTQGWVGVLLVPGRMGGAGGGFSLASLRSAPFLARALTFGAAGFLAQVGVLRPPLPVAPSAGAASIGDLGGTMLRFGRHAARMPTRPLPACRPRRPRRRPGPTAARRLAPPRRGQCPPNSSTNTLPSSRCAPLPPARSTHIGMCAPATNASALTHRTRGETQRCRDGDTEG